MINPVEPSIVALHGLLNFFICLVCLFCLIRQKLWRGYIVFGQTQLVEEVMWLSTIRKETRVRFSVRFVGATLLHHPEPINERAEQPSTQQQ